MNFAGMALWRYICVALHTFRGIFIDGDGPSTIRNRVGRYRCRHFGSAGLWVVGLCASVSPVAHGRRVSVYSLLSFRNS